MLWGCESTLTLLFVMTQIVTFKDSEELPVLIHCDSSTNNLDVKI